MIDKLKTYWNRRVVYWKRNEIILNDLHRKTNLNHVNLHWYSCGRTDGMENFGDFLAVPIYQYMLNKFGIDVALGEFPFSLLDNTFGPKDRIP